MTKEKYNYLINNPSMTSLIMSLINIDFKLSAYAGAFLYELITELKTNYIAIYYPCPGEYKNIL